MQVYEYSAIPAPTHAEKNRGLKTQGEKFGATVAAVMNRMAADGWEYLRADVLPCEERKGLTGRQTVFHNLLVFRRALAQPEGNMVLLAGADLPEPLEAPEIAPEAVPTFLSASYAGLAPRLSAHAEPGPAPRLGPADPDA